MLPAAPTKGPAIEVTYVILRVAAPAAHSDQPPKQNDIAPITTKAPPTIIDPIDTECDDSLIYLANSTASSSNFTWRSSALLMYLAHLPATEMHSFDNTLDSSSIY